MIESPFFLYPSTFSDETYQQGTLYIPEGTMDLYTRFNGWRNFLKIVERTSDETNVNCISTDAITEKSRFTFDGQRINSTKKRLNIVVMNDGTVKKVVKK